MASEAAVMSEVFCESVRHEQRVTIETPPTLARVYKPAYLFSPVLALSLPTTSLISILFQT